MRNLVKVLNDQVVTSSVDVAENFEREHHDVIKSIEKMKKDVGTFTEMFYQENGRDSYGRFRKTYLMNRNGFTLLAMGFTGKKAMDFKLKYIEAFNEMEKELKKPNTTKILLQASLEHEERLEGVEEDVNYLKDSMRISSTQQLEIQSKAKSKVVKALGGKESPAYKSFNRKAFSRFWNEFKNYFFV